MRSALNAIYLIVYVAVTLIQYAHPPAVPQFPYVYIWVICPLLYPIWFKFAHKQVGFWAGLSTLLLISVIAQVIEAFVYLVKTNGFQKHDTGTVLFLCFYLIGPLVTTALWYPIGYVVSWLLSRRNGSSSSAL
jgi:hypothetical protein